MTYRYDVKNIGEKLKQHEIDELLAYCEEHGFSEDQKEAFVRNSIESLYSEEN